MKKEIRNFQKLKAFISYSNKDCSFAEKFKNTLEKYGLDCFLAHQSLRVSDDWRERLIEEINSRDIFISILSKNFRTSVWAQQEAGIAMANPKIRIFPITLGNTRLQTADSTPFFGFLNQIQSQKISTKTLKGINKFIHTLTEKYPRHLIPHLLKPMYEIDRWREAEAFVHNLIPHFKRFSKREVDLFMDAAISNNQVWDADLCAEEYLPEFLKINRKKIIKQKLKMLQYQIDHREPYTLRRKK